jgi:RNA polymerase sigma-70 factor (ECF subfamily)
MCPVEQPLASTPGPFFSVREPVPARPIEPPAASAEPVKVSLSFQDQQTLSQLRRGNYVAMEQLVHRYQDRLYVTILRMVNHPEDAADLVQETFVRAMQSVARFEGKSSLYTWLFRIAVNLAISHRRSRQYRNAASLDLPSETEGENLNRQAAGLRRQLEQETEADPADAAGQRMDYQRLLQALGQLEPEFRAVIILRDVEECDYEEIAQILDVPLGTIKSRLFRARAALREQMREPGSK